MEAVVLHRVAFLEYFSPKQGQDFKPSAAPLYPNMGPPGVIFLFVPQRKLREIISNGWINRNEMNCS